jgi:multidrug efflux pump subunit AcrB
MPEGDKLVGVRVRLPESAHRRIEQIDQLLIRAPDGHMLPLSRVATVSAQTGQPEIDHENLKRMIAVTARIAGRDLGSTMRDVKRLLARPGELPPGMYYELGGLYHQQQVAFRGLTIVLLTAFALVFTLLLFLYESFRAAIAVMLQPLLAICAVLIGLWVTGIELNISAMMGMTMIVGIVTELAIFFFSELAEAEASADGETRPLLRSMLLQAGRNRMRAILMSAIAMVLTLLPLALALGRGAQMQQPLAVAIISGMLAAPPLVLVVMPTIYAVLMRDRRSVA